MQMITITPNEAGQRFDKLLSKYLNQAGKGFIYKMLRKKNITLNDKKADGSERLLIGDVVKLYLSDETIEKFSRRDSPDLQIAPQVDILYEDSHLLILNKPAGMLSQKAKEGDISMVEHVIAYLRQTGQLTEEQMKSFRPSVCNRLDRNTSGIIVAGKSLAGLQAMSGMFKERTMDKYYLCVVQGRMEEGRRITGYLSKDEEKNQVFITERPMEGALPIETEYTPLCVGQNLTLLKVKLITGRSHQIRAHLASIGHPIGGDAKYGDPALNRRLREQYGVKSQLLHSYRLVMPKTKPPLEQVSGRSFEAPVPEIFLAVMKGEELSL